MAPWVRVLRSRLSGRSGDFPFRLNFLKPGLV
ncbi:hypothetical protein EDE08_113201 [Bradyrhizobium sp. R2.2-H]|nr:hypothetical protein EDE10_113201 [Bradyrhizobium sp. Y-H1]TCU67734.1 hypothetical protein EDE08_113201 [Bradyrhizobium sp. R2.2-H]